MVDVLGGGGVRVTVDFNLLLLVNCFGRLWLPACFF